MTVKKEHGVKRIIFPVFFFVMVFFLMSPLVCVGDDIVETIEVGNHVISLKQGEDLDVYEMIVFNYTFFYHSGGSSEAKKPVSFNGTLYFWVSGENTDLAIECQGLDVFYERHGATNVSINLGNNNLSIQPNGHITFNLSYSLSSSFFKKLVYRTHILEMTILAEDYPRGNIPIQYDSSSDTYFSSLGEQNSSFSFHIDFVTPPSCSLWNTFSLVLLGLVIFFIIAMLYFFYRPKKDKFEKEPTESLELRKKLLMNSLKTVESERGKGRVPDTYYSIIKDDYKKKAVRIIQELEKRK